ncbi:hypothetical protein JTB14_034990 [Gonioctena quinquepunctata]|nr:hypothetical protein JTB14_034990 [Gonioctena quinquepunctata]
MKLVWENNDNEEKIVMYADAVWAGDSRDRKVASGFICIFQQIPNKIEHKHVLIEFSYHVLSKRVNISALHPESIRDSDRIYVQRVREPI